MMAVEQWLSEERRRWSRLAAKKPQTGTAQTGTARTGKLSSPGDQFLSKQRTLFPTGQNRLGIR